MNIFLIILVAAIIAFVVLFLCVIVSIYQERKQFRREMSGEPGVYTGPAGDPYWDGQLPEKVDNYQQPRYVYENLVESTEYLPENGRIIGYRISPTLVIHSRVQDSVNLPVLVNYIKRFNGKLLDYDEVSILAAHWKDISALRVKAGDTPLVAKGIWCSYQGVPHIYISPNIRECPFPDVWHTLILKR